MPTGFSFPEGISQMLPRRLRPFGTGSGTKGIRLTDILSAAIRKSKISKNRSKKRIVLSVRDGYTEAMTKETGE